MTDERLDRLVRQLLTERADDVAALAMPAQTMAAVVGSHLRRGHATGRRQALLVAAALLVVLAAGAVAVGAGFLRETVQPQPSPLPVVPAPSEHASAPERVFYTEYRESHVGDPGCTEADANRFGSCVSSKLWVADPAGGNARELLPGDSERRRLVAVSARGDALAFEGPAEIEGQAVGATYVAHIGFAGDIVDSRVASNLVLDEGCDGVCAYDGEFAFSPDGTRLAYVRAARQGEEDYQTVVAVQEVATGDVIELESTRTRATEGFNSKPRWSPDGSRILFARESIGPTSSDDRIADTATFVVSDDGANLRQLVPTELFARDGAWSPDGETIAFTSAIAWLGVDPLTGKRELFNEDNDVYTVRSDGSDLRRLTAFAPSGEDRTGPAQLGGRMPSWTRDGRIIFLLTRWGVVDGDPAPLPPELWIMDADGGNATQLDGSNLAALTAAGCVDCAYPPPAFNLDFTAFWRPAP
jgi:hypothetical protein